MFKLVVGFLYLLAWSNFIVPNLAFCCTGSQENYFGSFGRQNNNNNSPKFAYQEVCANVRVHIRK